MSLAYFIWWCMSTIPAPRGQSWIHCKFKSPAYAKQQVPIKFKKREREREREKKKEEK